MAHGSAAIFFLLICSYFSVLTILLAARIPPINLPIVLSIDYAWSLLLLGLVEWMSMHTSYLAQQDMTGTSGLTALLIVQLLLKSLPCNFTAAKCKRYFTVHYV